MGASMKDVARLANVSTATVSHVINNTRNVNPETRDKVMKAIRDLHYNVNPVARNLRSGSSRVIGYVVSNLANYFFTDIALSIDSILSEKGYHLIYINSNEDPAKEEDNIRSLIMQNVDGLIIAPVGQDCSYMEKVIGNRCPCVFFDRKPNGFARDYILSTNFEGAFEGTEHLIERGHTQIGFINSRVDETMLERMNGYKAALEKHGLPVLDDLICSGTGQPMSMGELRTGESYQYARYLFEEKRVSAVFCGNALAGVGAISYIKEKALAIPEKAGVVTFDDSFWLSMSSPAVTAVNQNKFSIGQRAAGTLLERIEGDSRPYSEYRIPTNLVVRDSC